PDPPRVRSSRWRSVPLVRTAGGWFSGSTSCWAETQLWIHSLSGGDASGSEWRACSRSSSSETFDEADSARRPRLPVCAQLESSPVDEASRTVLREMLFTFWISWAPEVLLIERGTPASLRRSVVRV